MAVTRGQVDTVGVPLLERELPLAELADYAHEARAGSGRLVLVGGEAGVGKSALLEQLEIELPDARFSWGACDGLFIPRPLGPLFDLAGQLGGELQDLCRADAPREELFTALLRRIHEPGSLHVVVVEDIHWADEATLDLLLFLGRRLRTASALLICTYRDDALPASDPLRRVLGELGGGRSIRRMALAPLSAAAVGVLTEDSGLEAAELHRITGGNPFYVTAVLEAGTTDIPPSARDAVLSRVARLGETAREVLDVAALIGTRIEVSMLASVTPCAPPVIDDLLASGLLVGEGHWIRFRHEIGRLAVEQSIAPHRGALVHSRILAALLAADCNDDARMAFHAEAAGAGPAVLRHATSAARRASELASHRESAAQYERALRFSSSAGSRTVAELYDGWARELSLIDRSEEAADALEHALRRWRANGDRLRQGDTMRRLSVEMDRLCRGAAALAAAESALSLLEPAGPTVELAWAQANLANRLLLIDQYDPAVELARRAQATAEPLGVAEVVSNALNTEACAAAMQGQEGAALLRRALEIAVSGRFEEQAGRAFANLYSIHCGHRQFAEAERYFLDGIDYCREHEVHTYATCLLGERANTLEKTGRWVEARTLLAEVLDRAGASPGNRLCPLTRLGTIKARTGEPGVWECLDEAMRHADGSAEPQMIVPVRRARAEAYWLEGNVAAARGEIELAAEVSATCDEWERGAVAVWLRRLLPTSVALLDVADPYRCEVEGDATSAADIWTELGCPYDAALALLGASQEAQLREALAIFENLGAAAAARITRQRMRELGVRSIPVGARAATRAHPLGLTRREREVLDLICQGHTNGEIGAKLFISAKTVDHHVSAVLMKLGAPTRRVAASEARRLGLVGAEV